MRAEPLGPAHYTCGVGVRVQWSFDNLFIPITFLLCRSVLLSFLFSHGSILTPEFIFVLQDKGSEDWTRSDVGVPPVLDPGPVSSPSQLTHSWLLWAVPRGSSGSSGFYTFTEFFSPESSPAPGPAQCALSVHSTAHCCLVSNCFLVWKMQWFLPVLNPSYMSSTKLSASSEQVLTDLFQLLATHLTIGKAMT